ncbi:leucine carboxy methyltransferase SCDLUD_003325 [Saccharomycodes ludwigii]|uniref:leucine carboxy methyltransferase n=1 Tax=Saccharomycodes ludwigii TaxID=36035 RepID=UPI001E8C7E92|nr:hypothetical protein SCDLUD_003325 [Saccharomycodes ludwigii]KAH3900351.1 hypothetical protein SCDLUD_003325 [Saccharomycodes ludwigii]
MEQLVIQETDYDAISSKIACINKKYLPDPQIFSVYPNYELLYNSYFNELPKVTRRSYNKIKKLMSSNNYPIMNIGTYLRTVSIDHVLSLYLLPNSDNTEKNNHFQIINLGCGTDLRYFQYNHIYEERLERYIDVDFPMAIETKGRVLSNLNKKNPSLFDLNDNGGSTDGKYQLMSFNLNRNTDELIKQLELVGCDFSLKTIIITECCLCYIEDAKSIELISKLNSVFNAKTNNLHWVSYDPIGGTDKFGQIMTDNLLFQRNLKLPTLLTYNTKEKYSKRFSSIINSDISIKIEDMWEIFQTKIPLKEKTRVQKCEFLDELEELKIILSHYVILYF